jgi:hypothetical protein
LEHQERKGKRNVEQKGQLKKQKEKGRNKKKNKVRRNDKSNMEYMEFRTRFVIRVDLVQNSIAFSFN